MFGVPALRSEDPRFLRGAGRYLDNIEIPGALHAAFVRSIMPHARIDGVDVSGSLAAPGVVGVYVAADLNLAPLPPSGMVEREATGELEGLFGREPLARTVVRFVGEIVAVVVAETVGAGDRRRGVGGRRVRAARRRDRRGGGRRGGRTAALARVRDERRARVRAHGSRRPARGGRRRGPWAVRQPTGGCGTDGDERDRGGSGGRRLVHRLGVHADPVRRARRPRGDARGRARSRPRDRAGRGRCLRGQDAGLRRVPRGGRDRGSRSGGPSGGGRRGRSRWSRSPTAARRSRPWSSARRGTGRSWGSAPSCSPTWVRTRSARSCPARPRRCSAGRTGSLGS